MACSWGRMTDTQRLRKKSRRRVRPGSRLRSRLHSLTRRGDILPLQAILGILLLVVVAALIFGLFWVQARRFHASVTDPTVAEESAKAFGAGVALRAYLRTRLDTDLDAFLPAGQQGLRVGAAPMTFADALHRISKDAACVAALKKAGATYPPAGDTFTGLFQANVPPGLCRTFFLRTVLYWRVLARNDTFSLSTDSFTIGRGTSAPLLQGVQPVPDKLTLTLRLSPDMPLATPSYEGVAP